MVNSQRDKETKSLKDKERKRGRVEESKRRREYLSLEGCTVSNRGQRPRTAWNPLSISLEGCTPAKMAARAA